MPNAEPEVEIEMYAAVMRVTDLVCEAMQQQGVTRAELARRMGVSRPYITQLLRRDDNMTISTAVELLWHLGWRLDIHKVAL